MSRVRHALTPLGMTQSQSVTLSGVEGVVFTADQGGLC